MVYVQIGTQNSSSMVSLLWGGFSRITCLVEEGYGWVRVRASPGKVGVRRPIDGGRVSAAQLHGLEWGRAPTAPSAEAC